MCLSSFACCIWLLTENGKARHQKRDISLLTLEEGNGFWLQNDLWAGVCGGEVRTRDQLYTDSAFRLSVRNECFGFVCLDFCAWRAVSLTQHPSQGLTKRRHSVDSGCFVLTFHTYSVPFTWILAILCGYFISCKSWPGHVLLYT